MKSPGPRRFPIHRAPSPETRYSLLVTHYSSLITRYFAAHDRSHQPHSRRLLRLGGDPRRAGCRSGACQAVANSPKSPSSFTAPPESRSPFSRPPRNIASSTASRFSSASPARIRCSPRPKPAKAATSIFPPMRAICCSPARRSSSTRSCPWRPCAPCSPSERTTPRISRTFADLLRRDINISQANPDAAAIGKVVRGVLRRTNQWDAVQKHRTVEKDTVNKVAIDIAVGTVDAGFVWDSTVHQMSKRLSAIEFPASKISPRNHHRSSQDHAGTDRIPPLRPFASPPATTGCHISNRRALPQFMAILGR